MEFFRFAPEHMSLAGFSTQFIWRHQTGLEYMIRRDMLYLFESRFQHAAVCPMGPGDLLEAVRFIRDQESTHTIYCIGDRQREILEGEFLVSPFRDFFEYVYQTQDLIEMKGRKYNKKRNHINRFVSSYDYEYRRIDSQNQDQLQKVIEKWCENRDCDEEIHFYERKAISELLNNRVGIQYRVASIHVEGEMAAFSIGEQITPDMVTIHFEKADIHYQGLYQMMAREYLLHEWRDIPFVNRQEDMGISGLRIAKESYHPCFLVKNHCIRFNV